MLKLLLVDDEAIERTGVRYMLQHFGMEFELFEAENGKQALEILQDHPAHIVMTDIKMPIMDGLTLAAEIRKRYQGIKIVIFSAYGEFEYAKKAMVCDIKDYILKPLNPDEFQSVFARIINECTQQLLEEEQQQLEYALADILAGDRNIVPPPALTELLAGGALPLLIGTERSFFDREKISELFAQLLPMPFLYCSLTPDQCFLLLDAAPEQVEFELLHKIWQGLSCSCAGRVVLAQENPVTHLHQLSGVYKQLELCLENGFFLDIPVQMPVSSRDTPSNDSHIQEMVASICSSNNLEQARVQTFQLLEIFRQQKDYSSIYIRYICGEIIRQMVKKSGKLAPAPQRNTIERVFLEGDLADIQRQMDCFFVELTGSQDTESVDARRVIRMVQEIVGNRYQEDISLFCIAEDLYMNATYLSVLFKQQTGIPFIKYLTGFRMEKAIELVCNTNIRISDIGKLVGYPNSSYFGSVFRRCYGTTPAKYREDYEKNK